MTEYIYVLEQRYPGGVWMMEKYEVKKETKSTFVLNHAITRVVHKSSFNTFIDAGNAFKEMHLRNDKIVNGIVSAGIRAHDDAVIIMRQVASQEQTS